MKKEIPLSSQNFIVGIGASAGGLNAFKDFISHIPANSGMTFILVQHLDPNHRSLLPDLLQKVTSIPIVEIHDNLAIKPNSIYIIPSNKILTIQDGFLKLSPRDEDRSSRQLLIDIFFESLANEYSDKAIGIVLSGTGRDGTEGLKNIKKLGGITLAQDSNSASWEDMPQNAVQAGAVDFVLAPEEMPGKLKEIKNIFNLQEKDIENLESGEDKAFAQIINLLEEHEGANFNNYKKTTIHRRINRRMALKKMKDIAAYRDYLEKDKDEIRELFKDLLIPVTQFFRNPKTFNILCKDIFPQLINTAKGESIRIWVAGCSTGQEAFSMAICLAEYIESLKEKNIDSKTAENLYNKIQIFATDLSEHSIAKARKGFFKKSQITGLSDAQLQKFFTPKNKGYLINKEIRKMCVFAVHNFLSDYPFGSMNIVSCRNVLIYMDSYLQKKALTTFHYALKDKGILLLGKSESISNASDMYEDFDKKNKIFKRKDVARKKIFSLGNDGKSKRVFANNTLHNNGSRETDFQKNTEAILLKEYTPVGVVVNEHMDLVHVHGKTSKYLEQPTGRPSNNLLKLAKGGLGFEIQQVLKQTINTNKKQSKDNILIQSNNEHLNVSIEILPLHNMVECHYLILFNEGGLSKPTLLQNSTGDDIENEKDLRIQQLEKDLLRAREDMLAITEDQEAAKEELQSANEELMSGTEELQSLNEELETSKEELQSTVEEITVVNQELNTLNEKIIRDKKFTEAIIRTINNPLLVLDKDLIVTTANNSFYKGFHVVEKNTIGKKVYNLGNNQWDIPELRKLLENLLPQNDSFYDYEVTHDFESIGKRTLLLNAQKLRQDNESDNAILLSFEDITERKKAQASLKENINQYSEFINSSPWLIAILKGEDLVLELVNDSMLNAWGTDRSSIGKMLAKEVPELENQGFIQLLKNVYKTGIPYEAFQIPFVNGVDGESKIEYFDFIYHPQKNLNGEVIGVSMIATNVTTQVSLFKEVKESEQKFRQLADLMPDKVNSADGDGNVFYYNQSWLEYTGLSSSELLNDGWKKIVHPDDLEKAQIEYSKCLKTGSDFEMEIRFLSKEGNYKWHLCRSNAVLDENGNPQIWIGTNTEIQKLKNEEKRKSDFLKLVSHELKTPITSVKGYVQMLLSMVQANMDKPIASIPLQSSLERIDSQITRLTKLISEMLDLTRMEESKLDLDREDVNLTKLVADTVLDIEHSSNEAKINAVYDCDCHVFADKDRIGQVLINFITNAVKYSNGQNVDVRVFENEDGSASVSVKDSGIGINKKDLNKIFNRFYRVSGKNEETYAGFGIGLFLAKEIIDRHNGSIDVTSTIGKGSTFTFTLPTTKNGQE